ncbi:MAG: hypothetical protein J0M24_15950 [Verrucomicrobia bacterium]|nr:hypothetical protein [Verrucomicrobiota bacterium]
MKRPDFPARSAQHARRGIALVITLLMLSVVTITAVAFLAVSRRERAAVGSAAEQLNARLVAETGVNHALGRIASRISAVTNRLAYGGTNRLGDGGYFVSTNFGNPNFRIGPNFSYLDTRDYRQLTNVSYFRDDDFNRFNLASAADREQYARLLGNLYYDPRPPVFVATNRIPGDPVDFRFYLDLNRNGRFETNGLIAEFDRQGRVIGDLSDVRFAWGDPEWIGVLENPDVPHSGTNRFIGRFAYVVVPTSATLDLNFSGNNAKKIDVGQGGLFPADRNGINPPSGFYRNQGVGTWEMNLAGFFGALHPDIWMFRTDDYLYRTNRNDANQGLTFADAERLRRFRQERYAPPSAEQFFESDSGSSAVAHVRNVFEQDGVDGYSDGPLVVNRADIFNRFENDAPDLSWSGGDLTNRFADFNDLFNSDLGLSYRITGNYTNQGNVVIGNSTFDRYTFYRLINQLGTDSGDGRFETGTHPAYADLFRGREAVNPFGFYRRAKLNLNYAQENPNGDSVDSARVANFRPWQPLEWFTNATHRLLLSEFTNGLPFFPPRVDRPVPGLAINGWTRVNDNNTSYPTNYSYTAQVHRPLQMAANIFDATTNFFLDAGRRVAAPTVFRPLLYEDFRSPGVLRLHGFQEVTNGVTVDNLLRSEWTAPDLVTNGAPRWPMSPSVRLAPSAPEANPPITTRERNLNLFGIPWVVGAKKGLPNFNQALWQTVIQPTRRLIITRPTRTSRIGQTELPISGANTGGFRTAYQYVLSITNRIGVEGWNSYFTNFPRNVRIFATNVLEFTLMDETGPGAPVPILQRRELLSANILTNNWPARAYISPQFSRNTSSPLFYEFPNTITNSITTTPNGGLVIGTSFIYDPTAVSGVRAFPLTQTNQGRVVISQSNRRFLTPVISAYVTNSLLYAIIDDQSGRLLDIATLRSTMVRTNIISTLSFDSQGVEQEFVNAQAGTQTSASAGMPAFWSTNLVQNNRTRGIDNQLLVSIGDIQARSLWRNPPASPAGMDPIEFAIQGLKYFIYGEEPQGSSDFAARVRREYGSNLVVQVGFNPSPQVFLSDRRMANDPLVHYTKDDLAPGYFFLTDSGYTELQHEFFGLVPSTRVGGPTLTTNFVAFDVGTPFKEINAYAPWGTNANLTGVQAPTTGNSNPGNRNPNTSVPTAFDYSFKDPLIRSPADWNFPAGTNASFRFSGVGQLGRIHRGTPWQTIYLKSLDAFEVGPGEVSLMTRLGMGRLTWTGWAGNRFTHPTNDWKIVDLFTTALNDNAARGQLGVNQAGVSAWAAVLSGVPLLETTSTTNPDNPLPLFLEPGSPEITQMITGYTHAGTNVPGLLASMAAVKNGVQVNPDGVFPKLGSILQVPTFSDRAPFLNQDIGWTNATRVGDEVLERLPQQILSLLRADEPRFVVYSFGQTLKPAQGAVNLRPGPLYGIVTNYVITGEYVTKTVLRLDGDPRRLQPIIEDQRVILSNP